MDVIIGIGFDGASDPQAFRDSVAKVIRRLGTLNATIAGTSHSDEWGEEPGEWFAATFRDFDTYVEARARILSVGGVYSQDAIAFTVGTVDVAPCPKP